MDTYRQMRDVARKDWEGFHPATNCCWVRYLCDVVAKLKEVSMTPAEKKALQGLRCVRAGMLTCCSLVPRLTLRACPQGGRDQPPVQMVAGLPRADVAHLLCRHTHHSVSLRKHRCNTQTNLCFADEELN